jgi:hypothetical protein
MLSLGNHAAAFKKFSGAESLYVGSYLPGIPGKIIANTRKDLESFYRTAVMQTRRDYVNLSNSKYLPVI